MYQHHPSKAQPGVSVNGNKGRAGTGKSNRPSERDADETGQVDLCLIFKECARVRKHTGLTQEEVARRMGTTASAIARMEAYVPGKKPSPKLDTLIRYAQALGCTLVLKLERVKDEEILSSKR